MRATAIIPNLQYEDAHAAIKWLCAAFGFEKELVVPNEDESIAHAQLVLGKCMIMISSSNNGNAFDQLGLSVTPSQAGNRVTQSAYIVLDDEDMKYHYERAKDKGARILVDLKTEDYGGQGYTCADIEGHIWSFGSYDPWETH